MVGRGGRGKGGGDGLGDGGVLFFEEGWCEVRRIQRLA